MTTKLNKCQRHQQQQQPLSLLFTIVLFFTSTFLCVTVTEARRVHKRFVIHVPFKMKAHHHTHTVYSLIRTGGTKQTTYKVIGYSRHGHGYTDDKYPQHNHNHHHHHHHTEDDKYNYDDMHHPSCDGHKGDMVFNHYARNDKYSSYYPNVEEYIEDEQGDDEWRERRSMGFGCYGC